MQWTKEKPKGPGFYWIKRASGQRDVVRVRSGQFGLYAHEYENTIGGLGLDEVGKDILWAGPIPEPEL